MKTPDQVVPFSKEKKMDTTKRKEIPLPILQILKETAEKFHSLNQEAESWLLGKNFKLYRQKLEERAQLLINLPNLLSDNLEGSDPEIKQKIMVDVTGLAISAKKAIEMEGTFELRSLLMSMEDGADNNDLEKLIASLESK